LALAQCRNFSIIPHFSMQPSSSIPPACRFMLSKLLAAMLKSVPSPFSVLSSFFIPKPIARWLYQALCGFHNVFRMFTNCYWLKRKKKHVTRGVPFIVTRCTRTAHKNKADKRQRESKPGEREKRSAGTH